MKEFNDLLNAVRENRRLSAWVQQRGLEVYVDELVGEVDELKQGILNNDVPNIKEELGDVMWDTLTLMIIAQDKYGFKPEEVMDDILTKMKRRKPHIFEGKSVSMEEELMLWTQAKASEKNR